MLTSQFTVILASGPCSRWLISRATTTRSAAGSLKSITPSVGLLTGTAASAGDFWLFIQSSGSFRMFQWEWCERKSTINRQVWQGVMLRCFSHHTVSRRSVLGEGKQEELMIAYSCLECLCHCSRLEKAFHYFDTTCKATRLIVGRAIKPCNSYHSDRMVSLFVARVSAVMLTPFVSSDMQTSQHASSSLNLYPLASRGASRFLCVRKYQLTRSSKSTKFFLSLVRGQLHTAKNKKKQEALNWYHC